MDTNSKQALMGAWAYAVITGMFYVAVVRTMSDGSDSSNERQAPLEYNPISVTTSGVWRAQENMPEMEKRNVLKQNGLALIIQ